MKVGAWAKSLFSKENLKTSAAGVVTLLGAAATGYGMYTGAVPITPASVGNLAAATSAGVGLILAKDSAAPKALNEVSVVAKELDPLYAPIKTAVEAAGEQAKVQAALQAAAAITSLAPKEGA